MIALGRLLLAVSFLVAIGVDISQPALAPTQTYALLIAYLVFAAAVTAAIWNDWWLDAKLAGPSHAIDIILFIAIVFLTEGYTSPFFVFFIFLLLAAAIRWGWRETALTAILVAILYLVAGIYAASSGGFELYRFIIRTGQLIITSLILIWFGIHQWRARIPSGAEELLAEPMLDRSPLETGMAAAMHALHANAGAFVWLESGEEFKSLVSRAGEISTTALDPATIAEVASAPFLYDIAKKRTLTRNPERSLVAGSPAEAIGDAIENALGLSEGLAIPIRTATGEGQLFLEDINGLSTDHIDLGEQLAIDLAAHIQRHALLKAAADSAEARSRLALARDLHDSVVQFLAGVAFRLEAMIRSEASGRRLEPELNELKKLMMQEQVELRAFITALRSRSRIALGDLARDLQALSERLSRQWAIDCEFAAESADVMVSTDVHLDAHQLVREAVANAVRHAGAKSIRIALSAGRKAVRLDVVNDGASYPKHGERLDLPQSLRERVEQAGGEIDLSRGMNVTKVSISLPVAGRSA